MDKEAIDIPLSPQEEYLASQLTGRSLFSALQLAKEQEIKRKQMMHSGGGDGDVLKIPIPENLLAHKTGSYDNENNSMLASALGHVSRHPARMLFGGQEGFREAKKDFYLSQKAQIQKEMMQAQKEYIDTLSRIKTGSDEEASSTPCVDAFCAGAAYAASFGKTAYHNDVNIEDDSLKQFFGDIKNTALKPIRPVGEAAASGLMNTAFGTAYLTSLLRKNMRENPDEYMEENLPTRVELQPYH
jgi:hypothetical protein